MNSYSIGQKIANKYQVINIFQGGMGQVYLCLDIKQNEVFALKTFERNHYMNVDFYNNLKAEVRTWINLGSHPNIVRCYHLEELDSQPFIVLEWVASTENSETSLRYYMRDNNLNLRQSLDILIDVCRGLVHSNKKLPGIVHCDLKPENILLGSGMTAKITDFGLAKIMKHVVSDENEEVDSQYRVSNIGGTYQYMAPEQWHRAELDQRTDIYGIGCIMHELLTGKLPFEAKRVRDLGKLHLEAEIPQISDKYNLPKSIDSVLAQAMAKEKRERFENIEALISKLTDIYTQEFSENPKQLNLNQKLSGSDYISRGFTFEKLNEYELAYDNYNSAVELMPDSAIAYNNRGNTLYFLMRYDESLRDLTRAIELDPSFTMAYVNRGSVLKQLNRFEEAARNYTTAIELDPALPYAYLNRGILYMEQDRLDEALRDLSNAINIKSDFDTGLATRGNIYFKLREYPKALRDFDRAIELNPVNYNALRNRGVVYEEMEQYEDAILDYNNAIKIDPNFSAAYCDRGRIYALQGNYEQALRDINQAISFDNSNANYYSQRALAYSNQNLYETAVLDYTKALELDPLDTSTLLNRGTSYQQLNFLEKALKDYEQVITLDPNRSMAYLKIATLLNIIGAFGDMLLYLDRAAQLGDIASAMMATQFKEALNLDTSLPVDPIHLALKYIMESDIDELQKATTQYSLLLNHGFLQFMEEILSSEIAPTILSGERDASDSPEQADLLFELKQKISWLQTLAATNKPILDLDILSLYQERFAKSTSNKHNDPSTKALVEEYSDSLDLPATSTDPEAYIDYGKSYISFGHFDLALTAFNRALDLESGNGEAHAQRGLVYLHLQQNDKALEDFECAIELGIATVEIYNNVGLVYQRFYQYEKAIESFTKAILKEPLVEVSYKYRAGAYEDVQLYAASIEDYTRAIQINPKYFDAYVGRAAIYFLMQRFEEALSDFNAAIDIDSNNSKTFFNRAATKASLRQLKEAFEDYSMAIQINPLYATAFMQRASVSDELGNHKDAIIDCNVALQLNPDLHRAYMIRASAYVNLGDDEQALSEFKSILELDSRYAEAYLGIGKILLKRGLVKESLVYFASSSEHGNIEAQFILGQLKEMSKNDPVWNQVHLLAGGDFLEAKSLSKMRELVNNIPDLAEPESIKLLEIYIKDNITDPKLKDIFTHRAKLLKEVMDERKRNEPLKESKLSAHKNGDSEATDVLAAPDKPDKSQNSGQTAEDYFTQALLAVKDKNYHAALNHLNKSIELNPQSIDAYINRGDIHVYFQNIDDAIKDYDFALDRNPTSSALYLKRGYAYYHLSTSYDKALLDYNKALELNPEFPDAYVKLAAITVVKNGDFDTAINYLVRAQNLNYLNADNLIERFKKWSSAKLHETSSSDITIPLLAFIEANSLDDLQSMIELFPYLIKGIAIQALEQFFRNVNTVELPLFAEKLTWLRQIADDRDDGHGFTISISLTSDLQEDDISKKVSDLDKSIQDYPDNPTNYYERGKYHEIRKDFLNAINDYSTAIVLDPNLYKAYSDRGKIFLLLGQEDKAYQDFTQVINAGLGDATTYSNRGVVYLNRQEHDNALKEFNKAIELDSNYVYAYVNRGAVYQDLSMYNEALKDYNLALRINPNSGIGYYKRGDLYIEIGNYSDGIVDYTRAIELDSENSSIYNARGSAYLSIGRFDRAFQDFTRSIELDSENAIYYYHRALAAFQLKDFTTSEDDCRRAIKLDASLSRPFTTLGNIYEQLERFDDAISEYKRAIEVEPTAPTGYRNVGAILANLNKLSEALPYFEKADELGDPVAGEYVVKVKRMLTVRTNENENAYEKLWEANSFEMIQKFAVKYPVMISSEFITDIENSLESQPYSVKLELEKRITWLKELRLSSEISQELSSDDDVYSAFTLLARELWDFSESEITEFDIDFDDFDIDYDDDSIADLVVLANTLENNKRYKEALIAHCRVLEHAPDRIETYRSRGVLHMMLKNPSLGILDFIEILRQDPNYSDVDELAMALIEYTFNEGKLLDITSRFPIILTSQVVSYLKNAYSTFPQFAKPSLTELLDKLTKISNQEIHHEASFIERVIDFVLLRFKANSAVEYLEASKKFMDKGQFVRAMLGLNHALRLDTHLTEGYLIRGKALQKLRRLETAILDYTAVIHRLQTSEAYLLRGECFQRKELFAQAALDFQQAIKLDSSNAAAYLGLGLCFMPLDRFEEALEHLKSAQALGNDEAQHLILIVEDALHNSFSRALLVLFYASNKQQVYDLTQKYPDLLVLNLKQHAKLNPLLSKVIKWVEEIKEEAV